MSSPPRRSTYFRAHPEEDATWKRQLHTAEDRTFDRFVAALLS